jgi:hypothetical protein
LQYGDVPISTIDTWLSIYRKAIKKGVAEDKIFSNNNRGRELLLGEHDSDVLLYLKQLRANGTAVNCHIVAATIDGILYAKKPSLLQCYGGYVNPNSRGLIQSIFRRLNWVRRRASSSEHKLPLDFKEKQNEYINRISEAIKNNNISDALVINWDQTGIHLVPTANWTMAEEGSEKVGIAYQGIIVSIIFSFENLSFCIHAFL